MHWKNYPLTVTLLVSVAAIVYSCSMLGLETSGGSGTTTQTNQNNAVGNQTNQNTGGLNTGGLQTDGCPVFQVDPSKQLPQLSQAEWDQMCDALADCFLYTISNEQYCQAVAAAWVAQNYPQMPPQEQQQQCQALYDMCLQNQEADWEGAVEQIRQDCKAGYQAYFANPQECTATVQEYQACVAAMVQEMANYVASLGNCQNIPATVPQETPFDNDQFPPECQPLEQKCPIVLYGNEAEY